MESDSLGVEAVTSEEEKLKVAFPRYSIGLLHGRMSGPLKEKAMRAFVKGEIDILISTAVVEVGIDVSNATVMMIESPERFGLAQLHQFRGRVGRGEYQSYCYIIAEDTIAQTNERLKFFTKIDNGFDLSEKDLSVRGPGELYGFAQSGLSQFKIATLKDVEIMKKVKKLVGD
jgi:ATP-dependent DNA helicase RecG